MTAREPAPGDATGPATSAMPEETPVVDDGRCGTAGARISALIPLGLALVCVAASLQLPLGTPARPGAGLWPLLVSTGAAVASALLAVVARRVEPPERFTRDAVWVLLAVLSLAAYTVLLPLIGFEIPLFLLLVLWLRGIGRERWRTTVLVAVGCTLGFSLLFIALLGLTLPHLLTWG
jgi:putative tricarboxylic transport membrane protein